MRRLGGGFGGKGTRTLYLSNAAALAAFKLKKPVRISLPFEINMRMVGKRMPLYSTYEIGVNGKGVIQHMDAHLYTDVGIVGNEHMEPVFLLAFENCYDISTWNFSTYMVVTDMPSNTFTRAPGMSFIVTF